VRYWRTPPAEAPCDAQVADRWARDQDAPTLAAPDDPVVRPDALTGVQALERQDPGWPLAPGTVERRECESIRHGTCACLLSRNVVTGQSVAPHGGATRTAADVLAHVPAGVARDPRVYRWPCVVDTLDRHRSASLVRCVAAASLLELDLGEQGTHGLLATRQSRAAFWRDPSPRLVCHETPKQTSWMNQIDIWLSLVGRKLLTRGSFTSVTDVKRKLLAFIDDDHRTRAKPFNWTYQGNVLAASTVDLLRPSCTRRFVHSWNS